MNFCRTTAAIFSAAALLYIAAPAPPAHAAVADWIKGASLVPAHSTDLASDNAKQSMRDLRATGANYVAFVVPYYQSNQWSTDVARGWNTPTDESLAAAIDFAHGIGLDVAIKMHVEPYDGAWRAYINPSDRSAWFAAYGGAVVHTAGIAEAHGAELFVVGSELVSMAASSMNSSNTRNWQNLIGRVRDAYSGEITYGANSNNTSDDPFNNEKKFIGFWGSLDYAGIDPYVELNSDDSVEGMMGAWDHWNQQDIRPFAQQVGKPVLITEVGYRSVDNARMDPWNWGRGGPVDHAEQANAYDALMGYWNDYPYMRGVLFWHWDTNPGAGGNDTSYTPQNKPAEQVMTKWFTDPDDPNDPGTPPAVSGFDSSASASPASARVGEPVFIGARVESSSAAQNLIIDLEVYDSGGQKVHQEFFDNRSIGAGAALEVETAWTPQADGSYRATVGVFSANWGENYHWNDDAARISVSGQAPPDPDPDPDPEPDPDPDPSPQPGALEVWWPTSGASLSGTQPLKAMLPGMDVSQYAMHWRVDGGAPVEMYNSQEDYPHKEAWVDFSGWDWRGRGPYELTFTATQGGAVLGERVVSIFAD